MSGHAPTGARGWPMARGQPMGQLLTTSITGTAYPRRPTFDLIDAVAPGEAGVRITDARCGSFQRRDALDLNQCTQRETGDCNCGPRRRVGWEVLRVNLVHDGNWHNVAARTKDGRETTEHFAACVFEETRSAQLLISPCRKIVVLHTLAMVPPHASTTAFILSSS